MNCSKVASLCVVALIVFAACSSGPQEKAATSQDASNVVSASASEVRLAAGGQGVAEVRLSIAEGYHVNANPASDKFYIPTQLTVAPGEGIKPGEPVYPASVNKKFTFAEKPLAVYEREAVIKLPLSADGAATKGAHTLPVKIRVQPCNDQACLPPRTIETSIRLTVE
ncbi:MAG: protein-disulfide reductase DsbD N-terminal domain-containing protein [Acidobacteria bacterium]|nr:protein-disulfide reductase DsbD N-terminal domain-containing protein [Acidobacteriota bacterium]